MYTIFVELVYHADGYMCASHDHNQNKQRATALAERVSLKKVARLCASRTHYNFKMPSKDELCFLSEAKATTTQDFLSRDIDDLVLEIKENLRLKSRPAHLSSGKARTRASPYSVPSRTESKCGCCDGRRCIRRGLAARRSSDDPYEALQELLKDGDLIKEAVRRLQLGLSPKQRVYYDSDDELRTPPYPFDHIEV
nr:GSK-3-binding protein-like [Procambarus clarkii]